MSVVILGRDDLWRWTASAAVVLSLHAAGTIMLTRWHEPLVGDEESAAVVVDLAPFTTPPSESKEDIAPPGPEQQELEQPPEPEKREKVVEEKIEVPPPAANPEIAVPPPEEIAKPEPPKPLPQPTVPATTAPQRHQSPQPAQVASWHRKIVAQIERHKGYPARARSSHQTGIARVSFTIDRQGRVVASRIVDSSGFALLDQETMATVSRGQPFPPPPAELPGATFSFTLPIRFNVR